MVKIECLRLGKVGTLIIKVSKGRVKLVGVNIIIFAFEGFMRLAKNSISLANRTRMKVSTGFARI